MSRLVKCGLLVGFFVVASIAFGRWIDEPRTRQDLTPDQQAALGRITADSLRGHLSFIASDLLEGRGTPSRGLDLAAEYIAAQFRRAGLEPIGDDGYFQTADWKVNAPDEQSFQLQIEQSDRKILVPAASVSFNVTGALEVAKVSIVKIDAKDRDALKELTEDQLAGKAVITELSDPRRAESAKRQQEFRELAEFRKRMSELKVALIVAVERDSDGATGLTTGRFGGAGVPLIWVSDRRVATLATALPASGSDASVTLHVGAPRPKTVKVRNVAGVLRGTDPMLKDTYVLVTAHYDHLGTGPAVNGDGIFNGANDDGSGTVSVVELAGALASLKERPKRSLVFLTFYGEEHGLVGSRYYAQHPLVPIEKTVADINLEQVGRTDDVEGERRDGASMTGIDYSDVGPIFQAAGEAEGVKVVKHPLNSDRFFSASDNQALADLGVPAHTVCTAYIYPDYHGLGDHWEKVDYANMAKIDRMVARGLLRIADDAAEPHWNSENPKAARYLKTWSDRRR